MILFFTHLQPSFHTQSSKISIGFQVPLEDLEHVPKSIIITPIGHQIKDLN